MAGPKEHEVRLSLELRRIAKDIDRLLEEAAGRRMTFSLIIWRSDADVRAQYVSNGPREEVAAGMREMLSLWDHPDPPAHEVQ